MMVNLLIILFCLLICEKETFVKSQTQDNVDVEKILSELTIEEKIGQLSQVDIQQLVITNEDGTVSVSHELIKKYVHDFKVGSILNTPFSDSDSSLPWNSTQWRYIISEIHSLTLAYNSTRSEGGKRIPILYGIDSVHGANYIHDAVIFPQPINIAATFDPTQAFSAGQIASHDTRAAGIPFLFSPLLGISLNSMFWGRTYETFGEDPYLVGEMGREMIRGIQEHDNNLIPSRAAACAKHFIGYSNPKTGHDRAPSMIPERYLHNNFLPPWKEGIHKAGVMSVMTSYTETDGVPMTSNKRATKGILRDELGFDGMVLTDYEEVNNLHNWHHVAKDEQEATDLFLKDSDIDMSMVPFDIKGFQTRVLTALENGIVDEDRINRSVLRILKMKKALNLFEEASQIEPLKDLDVGSDRNLQQAFTMAKKSLILAVNKDNSLPFRGIMNDKTPTVSVTGPTSDSIRFQTGGWTLSWQGPENDQGFRYGSTVLTAAKQISNWKILQSCGVHINGKYCDTSKNNEHGVSDPTESINLAIKHAKQSYVSIICIGEENYAEKLGDIRDPYLPTGQIDLVKNIKEAKLRSGNHGQVIVVYFGGRPRLLRDMVDYVDAFIIAFLPGPESGKAVIDLINGHFNPSGKLPITWPKSVDGAGAPYFYPISENCKDYMPCDVEFSFGHGLSYTSFEYTDLKISSNSLLYDPFSLSGSETSSINVQVKVTNSGRLPGSDVVLFFSFDSNRHVTPDYKRLRYAQKVDLKPNQTTLVSMDLKVEDLRYVGNVDTSHFILQPGLEFKIGVGQATDCRLNDDDNLCTENIILKSSITNYMASCDISCSIWEKYGCMNLEKCWNMCTSAEGGDGWSWNYVQCIDSLTKTFPEDENHCWKLNTFCRDITKHENGLHVSAVVSIVALFLMFVLVGGLMLKVLNHKAKFSNLRQNEIETIQFSTIKIV